MDVSGVSLTPALTASSLTTTLPASSLGADQRSKETRSSERVDPVDPTQLPAPIKGLGIAPLDMFQVGDNDDIPVPPDPPRDPIAMVARMEFPQDPVFAEGEGDEASPEATPEPEAPKEPAPELARAVQVLDGDAAAPTLDIRS